MAMQPQQGQGQGGPEEAVKGLLEAVGSLRHSIVQSQAVPDEVNQGVDQATNQYIEVVGGLVGAGPSGGQGGPVPMEQMPGGRPMGPQG